jgi:hypothetical protein
MHRVELKAKTSTKKPTKTLMFLMHRVELKVPLQFGMGTGSLKPVPNAPCGVERARTGEKDCLSSCFVPNAPCGVERLEGLTRTQGRLWVPNAPCGVESTGKEQHMQC